MMKKTTKLIAGAVADGQLPSPLVMADFMGQVKAMISYPGFGDAHYAVFLAACEALNSAYREKNQADFSGCFATVLSLKKECHLRFK